MKKIFYMHLDGSFSCTSKLDLLSWWLTLSLNLSENVHHYYAVRHWGYDTLFKRNLNKSVYFLKKVYVSQYKTWFNQIGAAFFSGNVCVNLACTSLSSTSSAPGRLFLYWGSSIRVISVWIIFSCCSAEGYVSVMWMLEKIAGVGRDFVYLQHRHERDTVKFCTNHLWLNQA